MSARLQQGIAGLVLTLALSVAPVARADDSSEALARARFQAGAAALDASDLVTALRSFRAAYELEPCPEVLVIIAEVEERMGALPAAVASLQRYLELAPEGSLAGTARSRLEQLESSPFDPIGGTSATSPAAVPAERAASPGMELPLAPPSSQTRSTPVGVPTRPVPDAALVDAPLPQRRTARIRLPAFIAFGVGGLGASGALATGLMASGRYNDPANCTNHCGDGHTVSSRTLATTSAVLAGVAAAGIGAGIVLLLTTPARSERNRLVPALRLKLSAEKAAAGAVWTF